MARRLELDHARAGAATTALEAARARVLCRAELDSALVLDAFADAEPDETMARRYRRMADCESEHARSWALRVYETGSEMPDRGPSWMARALAAAARRFGPRAVAPVVRRLQRAHHGLAPGR